MRALKRLHLHPRGPSGLHQLCPLPFLRSQRMHQLNPSCPLEHLHPLPPPPKP